MDNNYSHCLSLQSLATERFALISGIQVFHQVEFHCWLKHFNIAPHVPLNFFHKKLYTLLIPGADQFFRFLTDSYNLFSVIVNSCIFVTFCPVFFAAVFIHFRCGILVLSYQIAAQSSSNFSILGTFPLLCS